MDASQGTQSTSAKLTDLSSYRLAIPATVSAPGSSIDAEEAEQDGGGFFYIRDFINEDEEEYLLQKVATAPQPKWKTLQHRRLQHWGGIISQKSGSLIPEPLPEWLTRYPPVLQRIKETGAFEGSAHQGANHCLVNEYLPGQGIMPHEDGGAYFPAVATISLGSHTLLDIYRYAAEPAGGAALQPDAAEADASTSATATPGARAREQEPAFSILQERRSLLITRGGAYKTYMHGIAERSSDSALHLARVINATDVRDASLREAIARARETLATARARGQLVTEEDGRVERSTRVSLTLRDVERVSKGLAGLLNRR